MNRQRNSAGDFFEIMWNPFQRLLVTSNQGDLKDISNHLAGKISKDFPWFTNQRTRLQHKFELPLTSTNRIVFFIGGRLTITFFNFKFITRNGTWKSTETPGTELWPAQLGVPLSPNHSQPKRPMANNLFAKAIRKKKKKQEPSHSLCVFSWLSCMFTDVCSWTPWIFCNFFQEWMVMVEKNTNRVDKPKRCNYYLCVKHNGSFKR